MHLVSQKRETSIYGAVKGDGLFLNNIHNKNIMLCCFCKETLLIKPSDYIINDPCKEASMCQYACGFNTMSVSMCN